MDLEGILKQLDRLPQPNNPTLDTLKRCLEADLVSPESALKAAYELGKFDGAVGMANVGKKQIAEPE